VSCGSFSFPKILSSSTSLKDMAHSALSSNNLQENSLDSLLFEAKLTTSHFEFKGNSKDEKKKYVFLIVDDEAFIRSAVKRVITAEFKSLNQNIDLNIVEAADGIECLIALYLSKNMNIKIDAIISDETMPFISGSYCSKIINEVVSNGGLKNVNMFISTALSDTNIQNNYSKVVKKIFTKPIDRNSIKEIIKNF